MDRDKNKTKRKRFKLINSIARTLHFVHETANKKNNKWTRRNVSLISLITHRPHVRNELFQSGLNGEKKKRSASFMILLHSHTAYTSTVHRKKKYGFEFNVRDHITLKIEENKIRRTKGTRSQVHIKHTHDYQEFPFIIKWHTMDSELFFFFFSFSKNEILYSNFNFLFLSRQRQYLPSMCKWDKMTQ